MALWSETAEPWADGTTSSGSCPRSRLLHLVRRGRPVATLPPPNPEFVVFALPALPRVTAGWSCNWRMSPLEHLTTQPGVGQALRTSRGGGSAGLLLGGSGYLLMELVTDGRPLLIGGLDGAQRRHFRFARHRHEFCSPVGIPALARMPLIASVMSPLVTVRSPSRSAVARSIDVSEATRAFIFSTASDMTLRT